MLARRWRLRRRASQRGMLLLAGGRRFGVGPYEGGEVSRGPLRGVQFVSTRSTRCGVTLTPNRSMLSSLWRGTTVTSSISQRKATSEGMRPVGRGRAIGGGGAWGFGGGGM